MSTLTIKETGNSNHSGNLKRVYETNTPPNERDEKVNSGLPWVVGHQESFCLYSQFPWIFSYYIQYYRKC